MPKQNYVWYASYGSNVFRDRFMLYIEGGTPKGSATNYPGCTDKREPLSEKPIILNHELYFAKESETWQKGGVGFVKVNRDPEVKTFGYMYLISREQFCEVVKQEIKSGENVALDFDKAIQDGNNVFRPNSWYGNLIHIGNEDNSPIFTFTNHRNINPVRKPSPNYLTMIVEGLLQTHKLNLNSIAEYLMAKEGVSGNYSLDELNKIIQPLIKAK